MKRLVSALFFTLFISACGGGGDSSGASESTNPEAGAGAGAGAGNGNDTSRSVLIFNPAEIKRTLTEGVSSAINLTATVNNPSDFSGASTVYAYFNDDKGVLLPDSRFIKNSETSYSVVLNTSTMLDAGSYQGDITVKLCRDSACTSQFAGSPMSLPYALTVTPAAETPVFALETGVALVSTPTWSRLTRTLAVSDKFSPNTQWSASSNQAWLTVGKSRGNLTLTANPASLATNTINYATITLSSPDASAHVPEPIKVALWKGAAAPMTTEKIAQAYSDIIADPIRPLIYVHNGGASIDVYNVYTAKKVGAIVDLGAALGSMTVSPNGDRLYAFDTANRSLVVVDLATLTKSDVWNLVSAATRASRLKAIRQNGVEIVLVNDGSAYLASSGVRIASTGIIGGDITATADGKRVYVQDEGFSPATVLAYDIDYSDVGEGTLRSSRIASASFINGASNGQDIAVSADGNRLYTASGAPYRCSSVSPANLSFIGSLPGGDAYPNNIKVGSDGRVFCGISGWYSGADFWVHDADGVLLKSFKFAGYAKNLIERQMVVSGDGFIVVGLTNDPILAIVPVGP